jgi:mono/diheme cytochrome c family protein
LIQPNEICPLSNPKIVYIFKDSRGATNMKSRRFVKRSVFVSLLFLFALVCARQFGAASMAAARPTAPQTDPGRALFLANCARCHGDDAKGKKGPDLTAAKRQAKWKDSDESLVKRITNGAFGMPKFGKTLKPEEIQTVANYVRSLKSE